METEFFFCARRVKHTSGKSLVKVRWKKPKPNWIKLNTDGSALDIPGLAGDGGIIKDHSGTWVASFARATSIATIIEAKLWVFQDDIFYFQNFYAHMERLFIWKYINFRNYYTY